MRRFSLVALCAAAAVLSAAARARGASPHTAALTDVADAAEPENPFDFNASVGFRRVVKQARITREGGNDRGQAAFADEMQYSQVTQALDMRAQISLYHDLELNVFLPYTFNQDASYVFRSGVTAENSTIINDPTLGAPLHDVPYNTYKGGLSSLDLGIAWSPWNDRRDDTKPTLTLRFAYAIPIGPAYNPKRSDNAAEDATLKNDPANGTDRAHPAPVGDKVHRIKLEAGMSKRFGPVEPFFVFNYTHAFADASAPSGMRPPLVGSATAGFEVVPWENPNERQKLSFELRLNAAYVGSGRTYSEVSDTLRDLTWVDDYASFTGGLHVLVQPIQYLRLSAGISLGHETQHLLTNENPGLPGANGVVDLNDPTQVNPHYLQQVDAPGHRFRAEETTIFGFYVALMLLL